jgi:predicted MFS family arabinose efflux permease
LVWPENAWIMSNFNSEPAAASHSTGQLLGLILSLSLAAALSLGITRFSYGLLLPPMRADLGWSYTLAGGMNTVNALGYLLGALLTPRWLQRHGAVPVLMLGAVLASIFMALSGFFVATGPLLLQRLLAGVASALVFIAGGLLAARLAALYPGRSGWLIGMYYGGTGFGIVLSAGLVPWVLRLAQGIDHSWAWAWWVLALVCGLITAWLAWVTRVLQGLAPAVPRGSPPAGRVKWRLLAFALSAYGMFGVGYIGYMTFVIALLKERGADATSITVFYALLGLAVVVSSRLWAGLLNRCQGGQALSLLCGLLGVATLLPALTSAWPVVLASGLLFGGVFLSLVASTTALVRHNLPPADWGGGISAFTIVFAVGQMVGPTAVGWVADGPGGLERGLLYSAGALWIGAWLASRQRALMVTPEDSQVAA